MHFLLINLPPWAQENPHIGIGYLSSYLRSKKVDFKVLDLNKRFFLAHPELQMLWHVENKNFWSNQDTFGLVRTAFDKDIAAAVQEVVDLRPDIIGFSVVDPKERLTIEFIGRIKNRYPKVKVVLGGPATSTEEQRKIFLDNLAYDIDSFVIGEGEEACYKVITNIDNRQILENIPGILIPSNGRSVYNPPRPITPLEKIPFPTYEEFDMSLYGRSLLVEWSRGCYSRCSFCKNWRLFPHYRAKEAGWVLSELAYHKETYGINEFTVVDSVLNGKPQTLYQICSLIIKDGLKIRWSGQIAPRTDMDLSFFQHMRKAGCCKLQIGVESASDKVLQNMRKAYTAETSQQAIRNAKKAGIETEVFIIIGFPGETEKEFRKTYVFIERNKSHIDTIKSINTLHLVAGTEIYEKGQERFNLKAYPEKDWHYLWETYDGNTYTARKRRAQALLDLSSRLGLKVMEANIHEGKEAVFEKIRTDKDTRDTLSLLRESINDIQRLPEKRVATIKKRNVVKWAILLFVWAYTFFYIIYFWCFMVTRKKILLGGRRK